MSTLSQKLLGVIKALPISFDDAIRSKYHDVVSGNANDLDGIKSLSGDVPHTQRAAQASAALKVLFGEKAVTRESPTYDDVKQENWAITCWLPAACIVKAQNAVEVALALKIVTFTQSKFAVRGRGHNANRGFSGVGESGVLIDITGLNDISLSLAKDTVSVGPGATWGGVYEKLEEHGLTAVGGRVDGVGVGGLLLMGGMSHFPNHWGLACDNVKNFEIVLADSKIVHANTIENPDLFRAMKASATNLGIATRFDLYTHLEHRVWCTVKVYSAADSERVMAAGVEIQRRMEEDDRIAFFLSIQPNMFMAGMLYRGQEPSPSTFDAFDAIEPTAVAIPAAMSTQHSLAKVLGMGLGSKLRREIGTSTVRPDADMYVELHHILQSIQVPDSVTVNFTYQPLGKSAAQVAERKGGNMLGLQPESQSFLGIIGQWSDDKDDMIAVSAVRRLISAIESCAKSKGLLLDYHFLNDAEQSQLPLNGYTTENIARLRAASQKWDPDAVFQNLQNSGFLLREVK